MTAIDPSHSGVLFNNRIEENARLHPFIWNFMYQGAGIGIGDINNDGLPDLYFCGNMVSDKLYLNKGDFVFQDISASAGIQDKLWSTGVNFVDVNADGLLDIYVVKNFFLLQESVRTNKLFINQGNLRFLEQAEAYGLDDTGYGIQSYFFDADHDGDLDCYLVNQPMDQYAAALARPETLDSLPYSDKFYVNEGGFFREHTKESGLLNRAYGLSLLPRDFNMDGLTDIYLCNDYNEGDKLFMNSGINRFNDEIKSRTGHSSFYSMGSDSDDINNDGWPDFIVLDMAFGDHIRSKTNMESMRPALFNALRAQGHQYQYAVNTLQLNNGEGNFSDIAHYAGISHTDWSWSPLFADLDLDGYPDLLVSNGILRDLRNNDFLNAFRNTRNLSINEGNYRQIIDAIPSTPVSNRLFRNRGNLGFEDQSIQAGFSEPGFSSGMAWGDLDGDGDADIVINNTNARASIYRNDTKKKPGFLKIRIEGAPGNSFGLGTTVTLYAGSRKSVKTLQTARGYLSSSEPVLIFGLGDQEGIDSLVVRWNNREHSVIHQPEPNQHVLVSYSRSEREAPVGLPDHVDAWLTEQKAIPFEHTENDHDDYAGQVLLPQKVSMNGPAIAVSDINGDRIEDLWIGNARSARPGLFIQTAQGQFIASEDLLARNTLSADALQAVFFDLENDGDQDLYIVQGGAEFREGHPNNSDQLLINNGNGSFHPKTLPPATKNEGHCAVSLDINGDGLTDLFVGGRSASGAYGVPGKSVLLLNINGSLEDRTASLCPELENLGMISDALAGDYDLDGDEDIILVGEWMPLTLLVNNGGSFSVQDILFEDQPLKGWWWCLEQADFDNDGDLDFLAGNLGENNKFKPDFNHPLMMYAGDIDGNGDHDIVLAKSKDSVVLPVRGKQCSSEEMPFIAEKFGSFRDYALASMDEIYAGTNIGDATRWDINTLSHYYIENQGKGRFRATVLPPLCQLAPIKAFCIDDINGDGHPDFYFGGNHYPVEPETVRYDAGVLGICFGDGKGHFEALERSALKNIKTYDLRDLKIIHGNIGKYLLVSNNNGPLQLFQARGKKQSK